MAARGVGPKSKCSSCGGNGAEQGTPCVDCGGTGRIPIVGTRYLGGEGKFTWVLEYIGPNPTPQYESMDAFLVQVVQTCNGGPAVGTTSAVEAKWFQTHRAVRP